MVPAPLWRAVRLGPGRRPAGRAAHRPVDHMGTGLVRIRHGRDGGERGPGDAVAGGDDPAARLRPDVRSWLLARIPGGTDASPRALRRARAVGRTPGRA